MDLSVNEHGIKAMQIQEQKEHPRKRPGFESPLNLKKKLLRQFLGLLFLSCFATLLFILGTFGMKEKPITGTKEEICQNRHLGSFSREFFK